MRRSYSDPDRGREVLISPPSRLMRSTMSRDVILVLGVVVVSREMAQAGGLAE